MAQVKIYGLEAHISIWRRQLSDVIHIAAIEALNIPEAKRFHRFIALKPEDFIFPNDHSERYCIIEVSLFEGRTMAAKRHYIRMLMAGLQALGIAAQDIEITLFETPRHNWGIRGLVADELELNYKVEV